MAAATAIAIEVTYTRDPQRGIVPKSYRPKSVGEAKRLIEATFEKNRWEEHSRRYYIGKKIGTEKDLAECSPEETRTVIEAMEKSHMIIFAD